MALLALWVLAALVTLGSTEVVHKWYPTKVSGDIFQTGNDEEISNISKLACIAFATNFPWCNLACPHGHRCLVSDVSVGRHHEESTSGSDIACWTKHACMFQGKGYGEGEVFVHNCVPMACVNGTVVMQLSKVPSSCRPPFTIVSGVGCVHRHSEVVTLCDPSKVCEEFGGHLVHPKDFESFAERLMDRSKETVWVGVKGREWEDKETYEADGEWENESTDSEEGPYEFICEIKM